MGYREHNVIPAQAGIQKVNMSRSFRRGDSKDNPTMSFPRRRESNLFFILSFRPPSRNPVWSNSLSCNALCRHLLLYHFFRQDCILFPKVIDRQSDSRL